MSLHFCLYSHFLKPFVCPFIQDRVYEFEKKRNVPVKYNRELWQTTVKAMKQIAEIRHKREAQFIKNRLRVGQMAELENERKNIEKHIHLIKGPEGNWVLWVWIACV